MILWEINFWCRQRATRSITQSSLSFKTVVGFIGLNEADLIDKVLDFDVADPFDLLHPQSLSYFFGKGALLKLVSLSFDQNFDQDVASCGQLLPRQELRVVLSIDELCESLEVAREAVHLQVKRSQELHR